MTTQKLTTNIKRLPIRKIIEFHNFVGKKIYNFVGKKMSTLSNDPA